MKTQDIIDMGLAWKQVTEMSSKEKMKKGLYNSNEFVIPEDVPMDERDMFMAKAAAAHKAGKTSFTMPGGKKHPVTMQKTTAKAVNSSANEENVTEGDAQTADRTPQMYVDPNTGKKKVRMVPHDKQIVDKDKDVNENKKMALQKALQKSAQSSEKGKAAVTLPKAPFEVPTKETSHDNEDDMEMKKKPAKGKDDTAEANPKMKNQKNADVQAEGGHMRPNSVNRMKEAMMQMWQEANDREDHYKGATKPDGMKDNRKGKGAEDMMKAADDAAANPDTTVEKGMDDVAKAGRAGPKAAARSNDNMKGDKAVINPVKKT